MMRISFKQAIAYTDDVQRWRFPGGQVMLRLDDVLIEDPPPTVEILVADAEPIESDDYPMESPWHRQGMNLLIDVVEHHFSGRKDFYAGGDMFLFFRVEDEQKARFRGPDFFFVRDTDHDAARHSWKVREENDRTPNVIVELTSASTKDVDFGVRKETYEQVLHVDDYFCYDPYDDILYGWQLRDGQYVELMPNDNGWLWSEQFKLWLGRWTGKVYGREAMYPRLYDTSGEQVLTELEAEIARVQSVQLENSRLAERLALLEKQVHSPPQQQTRVA